MLVRLNPRDNSRESKRRLGLLALGQKNQQMHERPGRNRHKPSKICAQGGWYSYFWEYSPWRIDSLRQRWVRCFMLPTLTQLNHSALRDKFDFIGKLLHIYHDREWCACVGVKLHVLVARWCRLLCRCTCLRQNMTLIPSCELPTGLSVSNSVVTSINEGCMMYDRNNIFHIESFVCRGLTF